MEKHTYEVYRVHEYDDGLGHITKKREYVGRTQAVSAAKARCNVEFRLRGKAMYGGSALYDMGSDSAVEVYYEAEEVG